MARLTKSTRLNSSIASVLSALLFLLAAESGVRLSTDRLPPAQEWHDDTLGIKVQHLENSRSNSTLLLMGTSQVLQGVDPPVFDRATNRRWVSYNVALSGGVPRLQEPWISEQVLPRLVPDVVVWGVNPLIDFYQPESLPVLQSYQSARATRSGALGRADRFISSKLALAQHRPELRDPQVVIQVLDGSNPTTPGPKLPVDENGYRRWFDNRNTPDVTSGFLTNFALGPNKDEEAAFVNTIELLLSSGIEVVVVEMPVTDSMLALMPSDSVAGHPFDREDYAARLRYLQALAEGAGAHFLAADATFAESEAFVDYDHFTEAAARDFSSWLGTNVDAVLAG